MTDEDGPERAAAYVRVSTQEQKEDGSHIGQRETIVDWAEDSGLDPGEWDTYHTTDDEGELATWASIDGKTTGDITWFEDIAISGQEDEREAYDRLMSAFEVYDVVVFRELSRFGRDPVTVTRDAQEIMEEGVEFVSVKEPSWDSTSAAGKYMMRQFANMNAFYADLRREQALKAAERRREKGLPLGRPKKLDETQREQVFDWRRMGLSYQDIAHLCLGDFGVDVSRETIRRYCKDAGVEPEA